MRVIFIEGNIGAGKTSLLTALGEHFGDRVRIVEEPVKVWEESGLLAECYDGTVSRATFQHVALATKTAALAEARSEGVAATAAVERLKDELAEASRTAPSSASAPARRASSAARASPRVSMSATFDRASLMPPSRAFIVRPLPPDFKDALSSVIARTMHRDRSGSRIASSTRGALTCKRRPTTPSRC